MTNLNITAIVIAGGKSSRMGQNKALISYKGTRLIDKAILLMENYTQQVLISSNVPIQNISYPIVADEFAEIGPIGGLYSCLKASNAELNIVVPCDVPHIQSDIYDDIIEVSNSFDAVIPRLPNGKLEPIIACYKKSILPIIEECIKANDYKMINLLAKLNVKYIDILYTEQFMNMNTPNDLL